MMHEKYTIFAYPKIDNIYLVWDDPVHGSKCVFIFIGGKQYRWIRSFAFWRDLLSAVIYTHSSGVYTLSSVVINNSISYWDSCTVFDSIESLIEDLKVHALLEVL